MTSTVMDSARNMVTVVNRAGGVVSSPVSRKVRFVVKCYRDLVHSYSLSMCTYFQSVLLLFSQHSMHQSPAHCLQCSRYEESNKGNNSCKF